MGKTIRGRKGKKKIWLPRGNAMPPGKTILSEKEYNRKRDRSKDWYLEEWENDRTD